MSALLAALDFVAAHWQGLSLFVFWGMVSMLLCAYAARDL